MAELTQPFQQSSVDLGQERAGFNSRIQFTFQPKADPALGGLYRSVNCALIENEYRK